MVKLEIELTEEQDRRLTELAAERGVTRKQVLDEAVEDLIAYKGLKVSRAASPS